MVSLRQGQLISFTASCQTREKQVLLLNSPACSHFSQGRSEIFPWGRKGPSPSATESMCALLPQSTQTFQFVILCGSSNPDKWHGKEYYPISEIKKIRWSAVKRLSRAAQLSSNSTRGFNAAPGGKTLLSIYFQTPSCSQSRLNLSNNMSPKLNLTMSKQCHIVLVQHWSYLIFAHGPGTLWVNCFLYPLDAR